MIDEVQHLPELLNMVHALIEEKRGLQFVLTGSSERKLKKQGVNLLAGRALLKHMNPYVAAELGNQFDLNRALKQGLLPLVWESSSPEETMSSYAALYLRDEVQTEALVRNIGDFARFLEVISFSHASVINFANIARECDVSRSTVVSFVQIFQDLLLGYLIDVFTKRSQRALSNHPKLYIFDVGIYRSLRPKSVLDRVEEIEGPALEGLIAQHLRAWIEAQIEEHTLSFWRTRSGLEVDFIVYGPKGFWAIEVKNTTRLSPDDTHGLQAFREDYPESKQLLVYRGPRIMQKDILCLPVEDFLLHGDFANWV